MNILVLGYLVPTAEIDELCRTDRMPPMQTHRFMTGLVGSLRLSSKQPIDVISALPTNDYPHGPRVWVGFRKWTSASGLWWGMPFINVFPLKHITRFVSSFAMTCLWCLPRIARRKCIVVVSAATPQLSAAWLVARIFRSKFVPCLMDPPSVDLATDNRVRAISRRLDRWIAAKVLKRGDAVIAVAEPLGKLLVPNRPLQVFEGAAPDIPNVPPAPRSDKRFVSAYAGSIGKDYGIPKLIEAFQELDPDRHALWLFGKGDYEAEARAAAASSANVENFGFVTDGLDARLKSADLLLMVRPSEGGDSGFVFPSKILYYMALGVPTAITPLKGLPQEYFHYLFEMDDSTPGALADSIEQIAQMSPAQRELRAQRMADFARIHKSPQAMGEALYRFLAHVAGDSEPHSATI